MTLRDKYISEHLYDVGDIVDDIESNVTGVIVRRGTNYVVGKMRRWFTQMLVI